MSEPPNVVLHAQDVAAGLNHLAHAIADARLGDIPLALIGIRTRGVPMARRLGEILSRDRAIDPEVGAVDITLYRDDLSQISHTPVLRGTEVPFGVDGREIVLVDDVLFTGRTVRAAMDAICDLGRPAAIRLAVLIDRGRRELPIQPDYCAHHIDIGATERIDVRLQELDGVDEVRREKIEPRPRGEDMS